GAHPPSRPPPPFHHEAPPPYLDSLGGMYPIGPPHTAMPHEAPPPYFASPYQSQYHAPGECIIQPQGHIYPDISQLPQPQAGILPSSPYTSHAVSNLRAMCTPSVPYVPPAQPHIPYGGYNINSGPLELPPAYEEHPSAPDYYSLYADSSTNNDSRYGDPHDKKVPLGFMNPNATQMPPSTHTEFAAQQMNPPSVPVRPAYCSPGYNHLNIPQEALHHQGQGPWWTILKDGEAPSSCVISWKGGDGLKIYFIQEEGHIVSPTKSLQMALYKRIKGKGDAMEEALVGMVEVLGSWRLRLHGKTTYTLHTYSDTYVFFDDSTSPRRFVIIELPVDVTKRMRLDLLTLLQELTDLREEQEGVVGKITNNVGTVYTDVTKKLNTVIKDTVPGAHKSTKWLRKGTGNIVRMGGSLVSKGMHLIADQMPVSQPDNEDESPAHSELLEALIKFRKAKEEGTITFI
ncbi:hypothetical protein SK128_024347, partial [Halocaridina rubra]